MTSTRFPIAVNHQGLIAITCTRRGIRRSECARILRPGTEEPLPSYSNTNLTRNDQNGELMRFVGFWQAVTGFAPRWLYFDSKLIDYPEMSRVKQQGIHFNTISPPWFGHPPFSGTATSHRLGQGGLIDTPKRCHQQIRYLEEKVRLRGYEGPIRQIAVSGLGRDRPTLFISNHMEETPRELIIRYARAETELRTDWASASTLPPGLHSQVKYCLNVDLDATLTVIANGCYRLAGDAAPGFPDKAAPKQLYRRFVETGGTIAN